MMYFLCVGLVVGAMFQRRRVLSLLAKFRFCHRGFLRLVHDTLDSVLRDTIMFMSKEYVPPLLRCL